MNWKPNSSMQNLPPGFRFHPSDEELIVHYLKNKVTSSPVPALVIADIDLYKYNPWELPNKALFGEDEWFFFSPRDRKYPNGARPNRAAASGYWKATGTDKPILSNKGSKRIGVKKALVFYKGRPPKGLKTEWIMHEYRLLDTMIWNSKRKGSMRLDDWVLCRVRQKNSSPKNIWENQNGSSFEPFSSFSSIDDSDPTNTNFSVEMMKNYPYKDCPLLPYIFASQDLPCIGADSSLSFEDSNANTRNATTSVCKTSSDQNLQLSTSSLGDIFSPEKRKRTEQFQSNNFFSPCNVSDYEKDELILSVTDNCTEMNFSAGTKQSEGNSEVTNSFFADQWNSIIQYQELNYLAFTESN